MANIVEYFGNSEGSRECGYCKNSSASDYTYGMWAHNLSSQAYQWLIDRNWRRSGKYCYKPMNDRICCPMYTIRCDAAKFKLRKSHKKVIKNFNNFIKHDVRPSKSSQKKGVHKYGGDVNADECKDQRDKAQQSVGCFDNVQLEEPGASTKFTNKAEETSKSFTESALKKAGQKSELTQAQGNNITKEGDLLAKKAKVNQPGNTKKKYIRRQKLISKIVKRESCSEEEAKQILADRAARKQKTKSLEDFLSEANNNSSVKHVFKKKFILLSSNSSSKNTFESSYNVFRQYQLNIHKEPERKVSYPGFKHFLIDSPIKYQAMNIAPDQAAELVRFYGSFHQHYYIDDRLVAVAVLDILPNCISSVYLFYDPEFSFLNLGVYSALNEIALVRKFQKLLPDLKYYYMGFYINSCPKMTYKGQFLPSDLLCSETFRWVPIELCRVKLQALNCSYARFCDDLAVEDEDGKVEDSQVRLFHQNESIDLATARTKYSLKHSALKTIREYANLVGKKCVPNLMYYLE